MYYEAISEALPGVKIYFDLSENGVEKMLPLESFVETPATVTQEGN
jgi:hypothetical protein